MGSSADDVSYCGVDAIGRRGHESVAVRVDGVTIDSLGLVAAEAVRGQLPRCDDVVGDVAVEVVSVDVEGRG